MGHLVALSAPFPGAKRPLEEGAKLSFWDFVLLGGGSVRIPAAETYILGAWHPQYSHLLNLGGQVGVLWTSSVGEMDFTPVEQEYLRTILSDPRISFVWFGDLSLANTYPDKGFYAPYPLCVDGLEKPKAEKRDIATLFCPTKPSKNILNQLMAMKLVQRDRKLTLHTNIQGYDDILQTLDHVRHGWLPDGEYRALLASARVNLATSWAETFNYQVAEAALWGTPSVISATVPLPGQRVPNTNQPMEIASVITSALLAPNVAFEQMVDEAIRRNDLMRNILTSRGLL